MSATLTHTKTKTIESVIRGTTVFCLLSGCLLSSTVNAQNADPAQAQPAAVSTASASAGTSANRLGLFAGFTDRDDAEPSIGLHLEHPLNRQWSSGLILEHTRHEQGRNNATQLLGAVHYRPASAPRLRLSGGAGVEFNDHRDDNIMFRTMAGYDLFSNNRMTFTPSLAVNFGDIQESVTFGASVFFNL